MPYIRLRLSQVHPTTSDEAKLDSDDNSVALN